jgi:hypothetical protein
MSDHERLLKIVSTKTAIAILEERKQRLEAELATTIADLENAISELNQLEEK